MVVKLDRVRYIKFTSRGKTPSISQFVSTVRRIIRNLAGEVVLATSGVHVIELNTSDGIIRCTHLSRKVVEAALIILHFDDFNLRIVKVSGTLKALSKSAVDEDLDST